MTDFKILPQAVRDKYQADSEQQPNESTAAHAARAAQLAHKAEQVVAQAEEARQV